MRSPFSSPCHSASDTKTSRRNFFLAAASFACLPRPHAVADDTPSPVSNHCTLGFSTYGMKSLSTEEAIRSVAKIGFDAIELAVRTGWDADSATFGQARRASTRGILQDCGLRLTSLMEHVYPTSAENQQFALERLKLAASLAHDLEPNQTPIIQTVLGGGDFEGVKNQLRDRLGEWVQIANQERIVIAIKPHRGGAVSKPSEAVWLFEQLGKPERLRMVYDFSHYAFRNMTIQETIQTATPFISHVAVKEASQDGKRVLFDLPGENSIGEFSDILRQLYAAGYRGDINCEVSSMVSSKPNYDPIAAAKTCYKNMSQAFSDSRVPRP